MPGDAHGHLLAVDGGGSIFEGIRRVFSEASIKANQNVSADYRDVRCSSDYIHYF